MLRVHASNVGARARVGTRQPPDGRSPSGALTRAPRVVEGTGIASWSEDRRRMVPPQRAIRRMTSLIAWVGKDSRSLSSAYIATDSRISWGAGHVWDGGRKTFASDTSADIFGYVGDVLLPSVVLSQFTTLLDAGAWSQDVDQRFAALFALAREQVAACPSSQRRPFTLVHCARLGEGRTTRFRLAVTEYKAVSTWEQELHDAPDASAQILVSGSGQTSVDEALARWARSEVTGTSRAVFNAFVQSVSNGGDPLSGGPVQLVGLRRVGGGINFGVWHKRQRYIAGQPVPESAQARPVEWFNERFERCDGQTGALIGQPQPIPRQR
jgi:hypothetical protein